MITPKRFAVIALSLAIALPGFALDLDRPDVSAFIESMVRDHNYSQESLRNILGQAKIRRSIIDKIKKPAEKRLTWTEYRDIFITRERILAGVKFWSENREALDSVSDKTGVPIEILVGIVGVETYFGRIDGGHRVLDALATLAFDYPPRSAFFRAELEQFLLLVREENLAATEAVGSYAGAMGRPQFMPSSFRMYAVDSTGDGKRDIWNDWHDVAGSVANYFVRHGWRPGGEVITQATLGQHWQGPAPKNGLSANDTVGNLSRKGVMFSTNMDAECAGQLLTLKGSDGEEYWVGFHNFFVITRYNRSVMYAMAVHQLGQEIALEISANAS